MKTTKVSLRIIALFGVAILISKIPDLYPSFFGDWFCGGKGEGYTLSKIHCDIGCSYHNAKWHWGYQHVLFFLMGLSLSVFQVIDMIKIYNKD